MKNIKPPDILYISIKKKIEEFYDVHYFGVDAQDRKKLHLHLLDKYYRSDMFNGSDDLSQDLGNFLQTIHEMVESLFTD